MPGKVHHVADGGGLRLLLVGGNHHNDIAAVLPGDDHRHVAGLVGVHIHGDVPVPAAGGRHHNHIRQRRDGQQTQAERQDAEQT